MVKLVEPIFLKKKLSRILSLPSCVNTSQLVTKIQEEIFYYSILAENRVNVVDKEEHTSPDKRRIFVTWY